MGYGGGGRIKNGFGFAAFSYHPPVYILSLPESTSFSSYFKTEDGHLSWGHPQEPLLSHYSLEGYISHLQPCILHIFLYQKTYSRLFELCVVQAHITPTTGIKLYIGVCSPAQLCTFSKHIHNSIERRAAII